MPVRELRCDNTACEYSSIPKFEWFASSMSKGDPNCPKCGVKMTRLPSLFAAPWTGTLDRFKEPNRERFQESNDGGHYAWRVKSSRLAGGGPEKVLIRTHAEQKEFCKAEGLIMPDEINSNSEISDDGKRLYTTGTKGQWLTGLPSDEIRNTGTPWLYIED